MPGAADVEGYFDYFSFLCQLFDDVGFGRQTHWQEDALRAQADVVARNARLWADTVPIGPLAPALSERAESTLFHERVHFWQLLTCPLQQYEFIVFLNRLRAGANAVGATRDAIAVQGLAVASIAEAESALVGTRAHFGAVPEDVFISSVQGSNPIEYDLPTEMPFVLLPHSGRVRLPGYGAALGLLDGSMCYFPFTGRYLMESAAYLVEQLHGGRPPQRLTEKGDVVYRGAWEFWCRLHGPRHSDDDLVLGFLAAVDLALMSDPLISGEVDIDFPFEHYSLPYRFGKLAFRAQGIPPFRRERSDVAEDISNYQRELARLSAWPDPEVSVTKMAVLLTQLLLASCIDYVPESSESVGLVKRFFATPLDVAAADPSCLNPVWELLLAGSSGPPRIGQLILATMLNASVYRLRNPGRFAVPHLYTHELASAFPLPLLVTSSGYSWDVNIRGVTRTGSPYPVSTLELVHDCIALMSVASLRDDSEQCGFLAKGVRCWYQASGLGCPQAGLAASEDKIRRQSELDDWCHWRFATLRMGTADDDALARWNP